MAKHKKTKKREGKSKKRTVYHEPGMKYNVALHKFEPDLPVKSLEPVKNDIKKLHYYLLLIIIALIILVFMMKFAQI